MLNIFEDELIYQVWEDSEGPTNVVWLRNNGFVAIDSKGCKCSYKHAYMEPVWVLYYLQKGSVFYLMEDEVIYYA